MCRVPESKEFHGCHPQSLGSQLVGGAGLERGPSPSPTCPCQSPEAWSGLDSAPRSLRLVSPRFPSPGVSDPRPSCGQIREEPRQEVWGKPTAAGISRTLTRSPHLLMRQLRLRSQGARTPARGLVLFPSGVGSPRGLWPPHGRWLRVKVETSAMSWPRERVQSQIWAGQRGVREQDRQAVGPQVWATTGQAPALPPPGAVPGTNQGDGVAAARTTATKNRSPACFLLAAAFPPARAEGHPCKAQ